MFHGQFVGRETVFREYKDISFQHVGLPYDEDVCEQYVDTFTWDFNHLVVTSLQKYMTLYLPKYTCAFLDERTPDNEKGSLWIGVNDQGEITGIPFKGELKVESFLTPDVISEIKKKLVGEEDYNLMDLIDVEIVNISYTKKDLPSVHPHLDSYRKKKRELQKKIETHSRKYMKWQEKNDLYSSKLVDLYHNPTSRPVFLKYLRKHQKYDMIERIKKGEEIEQQSYEKIREFREHENNLYYWLCLWKDEILDKIRMNKPLREKSFRNLITKDTLYGPSHILIKAGEMIPWWMQNNQGMNLYVVRIVFKRNKINLRFMDHLHRLARCYRTIVRNQPCCLPY